jgi:hypothetical protein
MKAMVQGSTLSVLVSLPYASLDSVFTLYSAMYYPLYDNETGMTLTHAEHVPYLAHSFSGDYYLMLQFSDLVGSKQTNQKRVSYKRFPLNEVSRKR